MEYSFISAKYKKAIGPMKIINEVCENITNIYWNLWKMQDEMLKLRFVTQIKKA